MSYSNELDGQDDLVKIDASLSLTNFSDYVDQVVCAKRCWKDDEPLPQAVNPVSIFV